ncbi:MAG: hypothetical protein ACR2HH_02140 [Chthoniobacterales bacterium]
MHETPIASVPRSLGEVLANDPGVNQSYRHRPKLVTPGEAIEANGAILKWYRLGTEELPVSDEIEGMARDFLAGTTLGAKGFGFVILHRCGQDFYFLIVNTWRGNNEVWESVYYKDGDVMTQFALWPREETHKPSFCVWELAVVWHEAKAWERFLASARDEAAAQAWLHDLYQGSA